MLVVVGGAELVTGNNLIAMAWAVLVLLAGVPTLGGGVVGETMVQIARSKVARDPVSAVARGILCTVLVCLAVWLCMGARSVTDKILAILLPIRASHRQYVFPSDRYRAGSRRSSPASVLAALSNLVLVTIGNILGGTLLVAVVYWFIYLCTAGEGQVENVRSRISPHLKVQHGG